MLDIAARRLVQLIPVLLIISFLVFMLIHIVPGDPVAVLMGEGHSDPVVEQALRDRLALDRPLLLQFLAWFSRVLQGDLGMSLYSHQPVLTMILDRLPATALLAFAAAIIAIAISIPAGIVAAVYRDRIPGYVAMVFALLGVSVPSFWLAIMLVLVFSQSLGLLPSMGYTPPAEGLLDSLKHLVLPAFTLGLGMSASLTRLVRAEVLEELSQNYVRTAHAKGVGRLRVLLVHVLRNALIPMITVLGLQLAGLLEGAVFTETIFTWPGIGRLAVTAVFERDYALIQGIVLLAAILHVGMNLIVDIAYGWLDPRVTVN
jgi:peptide/nickel transport system permease protein